MHRRQFLAGITSALAVSRLTPFPGVAQGTPQASPTDHPSGAVDAAAVMFRWSDEDGIRSVMARVSQWPDVASATSFHRQVLQSGGSDLPNGEFYQSEVNAYELEELPEGVAGGMVGWSTTVGVAAFHTGYALLSVQREAMLWDVVITAANEPQAVMLGVDLAQRLPEIIPPPCSSLSGYLPTVEDVPEGATAEDYDPTDATTGQGTEHALNLPPIPMPPADDASCGSPA